VSEKEPDKSEVSQLWERIGNLEARVDESKKGFLGWINKWGVLIGLIATALSIVGAAISISSSIKDLNPKPDISVFASEDKIVHQTFHPEEQRVTFKIDFILTNSGGADDMIVIQGLLKVPGLPEEDISKYGGDFEVIDQTGRKLPRPFVLPKGSDLELTCSVSFDYSQGNANAFEKDGMRRLTIIFDDGTKPPPSLDYCFGGLFTPVPHEFFTQECPRGF
jgi:hypothetical protein